MYTLARRREELIYERAPLFFSSRIRLLSPMRHQQAVVQPDGLQDDLRCLHRQSPTSRLSHLSPPAGGYTKKKKSDNKERKKSYDLISITAVTITHVGKKSVYLTRMDRRRVYTCLQKNYTEAQCSFSPQRNTSSTHSCVVGWQDRLP